MKKFLPLIVICFCISPVHAQKRWFSRLFRTTKPAVQAQVQRSIPVTPVMTTSHIQIVNLPKQPVVQLRTPETSSPSTLQGRVLSEQQVTPVIFPGGLPAHKTFVPPALNSQEPVGYRGMALNNLDELKNILENGLGIEQSVNKEVFFSGRLHTALLFATRKKAKVVVLIQIQPPANIPLYEYYYEYYTKQDIPASALKTVMVFWEIDGKPGWYQVTLEEGELVFTAQPGQVFNNSERKEHSFDVPLERREDVW